MVASLLSRGSFFRLRTPALKLFRRLLLFLCEGKAFGFSPTCGAFPNVVSALTVSHRILTFTLSQAVPSFSLDPRLTNTHQPARGLLRGFFCFLACADFRKWDNLRRRIAVLAKRGLERQLAVRDFS
jgi:hypothetical protein